jgi:hypothetical protein
VPSLILKPNPSGEIAKKIMSSPCKKCVEANEKKNIKQATKSKTHRLSSNALIGASKKRNRRVCQDPTPPATLSDSDTDLVFLSLTIRLKKTRNKTLIVCTVLFVSLKTMEKTGYDVRNVSDGRTHFVLVWRNILFVRLYRDKHYFVLNLYTSYLYFFILQLFFVFSM